MKREHRHRWLPVACLALLAACASTSTNPPTPQEGAQYPLRVLAAPPQSGKIYRIDAKASSLHILVYRGGRLANLGHNHVISSQSISGSIWQGAGMDQSGFEISVLVNELIVDDNAARAAEGEDFPLNVSDDAKSGTRTNMLRETLLDGARFPVISIQSVRLQGDSDGAQVLAALRIRDQIREILMPVTLRFIDGSLRVKGEFDIKQTDFGITPLNVALGALLVQDTVKIKFELFALAQE
ncbi:MAG: YceI family protein [Candidatus Saccharibacteria bacterium]|nr:YceI family protein [Rhodoferax sp.]